MLQQIEIATRLAEVRERLAQVYDPELDQPLTELGFIGAIDIDGGSVSVTFRLPTFFCSPNFGFLMASDIRDRVSEVPWVTTVAVCLIDHHAGTEINEGVNGKRSFAETFPNLADGDLQELRQMFRRKAFIARQERLLRHLLGMGLSDGRIAELTVAELSAICDHESDRTALALLDRYLAIRTERGLGVAVDQPAFTDTDGRPLDRNRFRDYLKSARSVRLNMEFNTSLCTGLLHTRYNEPAIVNLDPEVLDS
jgi:metal-sulfur cluster biosynthetic enzyme